MNRVNTITDRLETKPAPLLDPGAAAPAAGPAFPSATGSAFGVRSLNSQPLAAPEQRDGGSTLNPQPSFPLLPGETPRAFTAFMAFFGLGYHRSLQGVAAQLGEKPDTVKTWSSRFRWSDRIQSFNSGLLQQQAEAKAALRRNQAADWARRSSDYREREWQAAQKLLAAVQCFLESFGDRHVEKMTLAQVSRALQISSRIARQALSGTSGPDEPVLAPLQVELAAALNKAYAQPPAPCQTEVPVESHP